MSAAAVTKNKLELVSLTTSHAHERVNMFHRFKLENFEA